MEKEYRNYGEIREYDIESRLVTGCALKFDSESQYMGFYEKIDRSAITQELIDNSDIFALLDHDQNKVLARQRYGQDGSLKLELREDGLYYSFEAPNTQYGNELLEHLKRGEIFASSFAFCLPQEGGDTITRDNDGIIHRTITHIHRLFDVSPVYEPAYLATSCSKRTLQILDEMNEIEQRKDEDNNDDNTIDNNDNLNKSDISDNDDNKTKEELDNKENKIEEPQKEEEKEEKNITRHNIMEKQFSLLRTIRAIANNQKLDELDAAVINAGQNEFRKAGVEFGGQIQLPNMIENRAAITVTAEGEDVVATDIYDILTPLRAKNVLVQAGAKFMTGLVGNVQVPVMSASNVSWAGETASASDGAGAFTHVTLSPKRLTAYIDISKQFLVQDGIGAENVIREDLIKAINAKLESTILGAAAGSATQPAGMFNGVTATSIADFGDVADVEAGVEEANVQGEIKYIMSPKAKAQLRSMIKGTAGVGMVYENDSVDGTPAYVTTNVGQYKYVLGDWSNYAIGQWGAIDLTVDPFTKAADGQVRLVINAFFDAKPLRSGVFGFGDTTPSE